MTVKEGKSVTLTCEVTGTPKPAIFWKRKNDVNFMKPGDDNGKICITEDMGQLIIRNTEYQDSGEYLCIAANRGGAVWVTFKVSVEGEACDNKIIIIIISYYLMYNTLLLIPNTSKPII